LIPKPWLAPAAHLAQRGRIKNAVFRHSAVSRSITTELEAATLLPRWNDPIIDKANMLSVHVSLTMGPVHDTISLIENIIVLAVKYLECIVAIS
jgi:hypothetical protein